MYWITFTVYAIKVPNHNKINITSLAIKISYLYIPLRPTNLQLVIN